MRLSATLFCALAGCAIALSAQSPTPQTPPFRAGVDVVKLDVSVIDKARRPVKGLSASDFTVLENGHPQPIVAFNEVDIPDAVTPSAPWMRDVAADVATNDLSVRRVMVIVLDDAHMPFDPGVSKFAKHIAHDVVAHMGPNDLAAVTFTMYGKKQNVTTNRARLNEAIDSLFPGSGGPCQFRGIHGCVVD